MAVAAVLARALSVGSQYEHVPYPCCRSAPRRSSLATLEAGRRPSGITVSSRVADDLCRCPSQNPRCGRVASCATATGGAEREELGSGRVRGGRWTAATPPSLRGLPPRNTQGCSARSTCHSEAGHSAQYLLRRGATRLQHAYVPNATHAHAQPHHRLRPSPSDS